MNILIAEDDKVILGALEFFLKKNNHQVRVATNGNDALQKIEEQIPDLIITDIMMPYISGLELVKIIKDRQLDEIRIVVLTTLGQEDVVLEAFSLGADDFLTKPFTPEELNLRIQRFS
ncbi:response regulator transcription factor [Wenyingzhuangia sp. IMCC45467]